jgi:hypothetical protein
MNIDYQKVVDFILRDNINKKGMADALKEVLINGYVMTGTDGEVRGFEKVFLKSKKSMKDFVLQERKNSLVILPINYINLTLGDNFEEIVEIRVNEDNYVVLSNVTQTEKKNEIYTTVTTWHNEGNNTYTEGVGKFMLFGEESINTLANKQSIAMFIKQSNLNRNDIFGDLYWDMEMLRRGFFIEAKKVSKLPINDGYKKEMFPELYQRLQKKIKEELTSANIPKLF